ncbi:hypothetical protein GLE_5387 [Lysobacter enzymogenes]|uniref:Uncharacterized protein n=1 Tax=Lysobacter enzymogenes TaxID=69 RepID=A0A0S2DRB6_LYSEN|nr:hypothetical protein GLE_5387 [Lysobacter enzymogenes]
MARRAGRPLSRFGGREAKCGGGPLRFGVAGRACYRGGYQ